ncbi:type II toxin-antitoxin system RelE/ParE family toxin [Thalassomonas sp. RHCl1]|uniref:type II toxin-antitoxin system RelE/ParE family toxin n=1 Tax=Thalassomonas sp. RHCl1 TaxID=2995320 RepID=UPI00248C218B|nr:type II toxin-antitoxin system RelE/ParE family toxin [Thalassomonas sp. RHCl1]
MTGKFKQSKNVDQDIVQITTRSFSDFGERQTIKYIEGLIETLQFLADNPELGRDYIHDKSQRSYLFYRYISHVIYYRQRKNDIFIVRILHTNMLPEIHF